MSDHLHVITGGPGTGKTTLIEALAKSGVKTVPESARPIIREEIEAGGNAVPWGDRAAYALRMLERDKAAHREALPCAGPVVFDRGILDIVGYLDLCGLPVPGELAAAAEACRYNRRVFLAPYWPEIYARDAERRQDPIEAEETGRALAAAYSRLGYDVECLPRVTVSERLAFLQNALRF